MIFNLPCTVLATTLGLALACGFTAPAWSAGPHKQIQADAQRPADLSAEPHDHGAGQALGVDWFRGHQLTWAY
ncbi:hypothetical protein [Pseudomonas sp. MWU13-2100]|uniref:hypothetical protein n=1 Tax=Pseudomonas sp. MWU13-2100 TaxID=2935075 RepID=UPI00200FE8FC|nr:hypothetical protein [Pseudomonas sp. MWU13-2100]